MGVDEQHPHSAGTRITRSARTRLRLLGSAGGRLSGTGPLRLALGQAVAGSGALGGMIHVRDPRRGERLLYGRTLICEVSDGSLTTPRIRRAAETDEGGRGLQLVAALSDRWGMRYTATGKCIWTEQALPAPSRPVVT
ncbi:putative regulatory protein phosphatase [Streptomyces malaysiensis]|uniref:Putative regulatory protein phosphatase n=1 Tax=Streptomyces malaysiensis TaxID=92644 RepID=A0A7X6AUW3_STRMQ|nr:putative regulatory protein phosphatase [Streptomyces malaysiensis]